ncbi:MAG TPA: hypothetical protein VIX80_03710, partial [Candidatus Kapabacteria bacterium]
MADYFFMKAGKAERPHEWLEILYRNDFFSGKSNPGQEYTSDAKNSYTTPLWNVLLFLENVAKKNSISDDDSISKLLVDIVNGIVSYRDNHGQRIENYLTDTYIANIISHLPGQYITSDLLYCVGTFLDGKTNSTP